MAARVGIPYRETQLTPCFLLRADSCVERPLLSDRFLYCGGAMGTQKDTDS